jgi:nucleotide sugar dehydrogenase
MKAIPKIVSGLDDEAPGSLRAIVELYSQVFDTVILVANPETAEMTKLYENCQRMVNIAYVNEMSDACAAHGINPYDVCKAAATKPFGYIPFTPGLGVGGHCIPINPYYLMSNNSFPLLQVATERMRQRPYEISQRLVSTLVRGTPEKDTEKHRVLVVGVAFKAGQSTMSNSPGCQLIQELGKSRVVQVSWADPLVEQSAIPSVQRLGTDHWNKERLDEFSMIVVVIRQTGLDFSVLGQLTQAKVEMLCP